MSQNKTLLLLAFIALFAFLQANAEDNFNKYLLESENQIKFQNTVSKNQKFNDLEKTDEYIDTLEYSSEISYDPQFVREKPSPDDTAD